MRSTTVNLAAFLSSRPTDIWAADLFTITLLNGTVYRYSGGDIDVTWQGNTWVNLGPAISRTSWSSKDTTDVPEMEITISSDGSDGGDTNIKAQMHNGLFDGAVVQLDRAIGAVPGQPLGIVTLFGGPSGQIELGAVMAKVTVKGWMVLLQQYMPRNTYQTSCIHSLYDAGCTAVRANFTAPNTVYSATPTTVQETDPMTVAAGVAPFSNFIGGTLAMTSGAAAGAKRTISTVTQAGSGSPAGSTTFSYPLYATPSTGDTLTASFGCDKTEGTCSGTFNNLQHVRSFPFIPPAEEAV
jgi:uncharacterized phage protein (TIGR02218 family)